MNARQIASDLGRAENLKSPFPLDEPSELILRMADLLQFASDIIYDEYGGDHHITKRFNYELLKIGIAYWWKK